MTETAQVGAGGPEVGLSGVLSKSVPGLSAVTRQPLGRGRFGLRERPQGR